jgi:hypothetical protein
MEILRKSISCKICKSILNKPVILPCGQSICQQHVDEQKRDKQLNCQLCLSGHQIPEDGGFIRNQAIEEQIKASIHCLDFGEEYKNASESVARLAQVFDSLKVLKNDPYSLLDDFLSALKNQIDLKREEMKMSIDERADEQLSGISSFEAECKQGIQQQVDKLKQLENVLDVVSQELDEWTRVLNRLEINQVEWARIKNETEKRCQELGLYYASLKYDLFIGKWKAVVQNEQSKFTNQEAVNKFRCAQAAGILAFFNSKKKLSFLYLLFKASIKLKCMM